MKLTSTLVVCIVAGLAVIGVPSADGDQALHGTSTEAAAAAGTSITQIGESGDEVLSVVSESASGNSVVALGTNVGGYDAPNSLYSFNTTAPTVDFAIDKYSPAAAVSPSGRFAAWVAGPCTVLNQGNTRDAVVTLVDRADPSAGTRAIRLPPDWTKIGVVNLAVTSAGAVTIVASHIEDDLCLGSFSTGDHTGTPPQGGPASAILSAGPGAARFHVVRTSNAAPAISPDGHRVTVDCDMCELSNSGSRFGTAGVTGQRLTSSDPVASAMLPPIHGGEYSLLGMHSGINGTSPTSDSVLITADKNESVGCCTLSPPHTQGLLLWHPDGGKPTIVPVPAYLRNSDLNAGAWLTPSVMIDFPLEGHVFGVTNHVVLFDPITHRWGPVRTFRNPETTFEYCALPSGKILVVAGVDSYASDAMTNGTIYISSGTRLVPVSSGLHSIAGISCPGGPDIYVSAAEKLYAINAASVGPTHWSVGPQSLGGTIAAGGDKFTQISAASGTVCGLESSGKAVCWGDNTPGALNVPAADSFTQIAAGDGYACGLEASGTAVCWGQNAQGNATPVPADSFTELATAGNFTCGLKVGGAAVCWGHRPDGNPMPADSFTQITTANALFACGLETGGTAVCWGLSDTGASEAPEPPAGDTFAEITAGGAYACGLETGGIAVCWGNDPDGPSITAPADTFTQISAGYVSACGLETNGTAVCWGDNIDGGATPPTARFTQIAEGSGFGCGIETSGATVCWGLKEDALAG